MPREGRGRKTGPSRSTAWIWACWTMTFTAWPRRMKWNQDRLTAEHQEVLTICLAELDRVWPKIPQHARAFFAAERELANYLLTSRGARTLE
jgi:hypothetical protein